MPVRTAPETLLELSNAYVAARALHVVAELGIADALDGEPRTAGELAAETGATPDALDRVLRLLESHGVFTRLGSSGWCHSESSRLLRSDHPQSLRAFARMAGTPISWAPVAALEHVVRTGEPSIRKLEPRGPWAYLEANPEERDVFQQAMTAKAHGDVSAVLAAYDFCRHPRIADIGGGRGHLVQAILDADPAVAGVLFDVPQVTAAVTPTSRLEIVAGDFFSDPLPVCDAYLLMNVIHDYDDEHAARILAAVTDAGRDTNATVLVIEPILPDGPEPHWSKTLDVIMLAVTGGRERTLDQYEALLTRNGMDLLRVVQTSTPYSILEARVAASKDS